MNHKPVCVKCERELKPERNGVGCLDMADFGPCAVWDSDLWKCPTCGFVTKNQPNRTADAGVVRCLQLLKHKDKQGRNMKKVK